MTRVEKERRIVLAMIRIYCSKNHKHKNGLCPECEDLNNYAQKRLSYCRHGENKTFCSHCKTHCYAPKYREEIKKVMRFSGPRLLFYHPIMAIRHLIEDHSSK